MHYIITMKDGWKAGDCLECENSTCGCDAKIGGCPLANARVAFEMNSVEMCAMVVAKDKGKPVKLYAVEEGE